MSAIVTITIAIVAATTGFLIAAILTRGKFSDLEAEIDDLKRPKARVIDPREERA